MERWDEALQTIGDRGQKAQAQGDMRQRALVERYTREHRGNPEAVMQFARERVGEDRVEEILLPILEAIDAFERVFRSIHSRQDEVSRQMKIWVGNFRTVKRLLDALLEQEGVKPIENLQGGFDPHWHKVADTVSDPSKPDGAIVEETRRGYVRGTKILRKSEVVVVRNEK